MTGNFSDGTSIYLQIAEMLENDILRGVLEEEGQAPSTNELARAYSINPATAAKGINLLVDEGILYKRRGIGMFVAKGGRQRIMQKRKDAFFETYVKRLVREARALGITREELAAMLAKAGDRHQIKNCIVDGPLALDNALSLEAARHKKIESPVAGQADILLMPDLNAGNILDKSLRFFADYKTAGVVLGAKFPLIMTSRSDTAANKLNSIACAMLQLI